MSLAIANKSLPRVIHRGRTDLCCKQLYVAKEKTPELDVGGHWYNMSMNKFDASFHCPFCSERYEYCGCQNEDSAPLYAMLPCGDCGFEGHALAYFAGDNTGRCAYCHNNKRVVGVSTSEADWF